MRKCFSFVMAAAVLATGLVGCGDKKAEKKPEAAPPAAPAAPPATPAPAAPEKK